LEESRLKAIAESNANEGHANVAAKLKADKNQAQVKGAKAMTEMEMVEFNPLAGSV